MVKLLILKGASSIVKNQLGDSPGGRFIIDSKKFLQTWQGDMVIMKQYYYSVLKSKVHLPHNL